MKSKKTDNGFQLACVHSAAGPRMVPYKLERSPRSRRMCLQFDSLQYVTLKLPPRCSVKSGVRFLEQNGEWICRTMDQTPRVRTLQQFLSENGRLSLAGCWHSIQMVFVHGNSAFRVDEAARQVRISLNTDLPAEKQMTAVLRRIARAFLPERLQLLARRIGLKPHGVTIRDQKSRWGSCSETGGISLNWRLILIAPKLQDHILLHELAHLRHFDHSADFKAYLRSIDSDTDKHDKLLHKEAERVFPLGRNR